MRIDFHTHILPCVDDGATHPIQSLKMLKALKESNIEAVVFTPHYYSDDEAISDFCKRREGAYLTMMEEKGEKEEYPLTILGCECAMWKGMSGYDLSSLCIGESNLLMCEMPYGYQKYVVDELEELIACGYIPVIAHLDRYFKLYERRHLERIISLKRMIFQINVASLSLLETRLRVRKMAKSGCRFVLGSDCHDLVHRPPIIKQGILNKMTLKKEFAESVLEIENLFLDL